jgi:hypothetical protein
MTSRTMTFLLMLTVAAASAGAQSRDTTARVATRRDTSAARADTGSVGSLACPRGGVLANAWVSGVRIGAGTVTTPRTGGVLDTVITLNITDRTWQRDSLSAGVSLGAAGQAGSQRGRWHACAGATATLGRITATLHNVHGQIHLRADAAALDAIGRTTGSTPPAPPRR